jgi:hypothetical protein
MKKFSKLKLFGFVIILTIALVFMAINFLEAKKPQRWGWEVSIPGSGTGLNLYAYNAEGNPYGNTFTDTDPIFVRVKKSRRTPYSFRLQIVKDQENFEKIGFQKLGLTLREDVDPSGEGPCSFPDYGPCWDPSDEMIPLCMKLFLESYAHPYTNDANENYDYKAFGLSIDVDCDIEGMNSGDTLFPSGNVHIDIVKTDSILDTGCEDLHSIVVARDVDEGSGIIKIKKLSDNSWEIIVDTDNDTIYFTEAYWGYRGKGKGKLETKKPIRAKAPFRFTTTWTRTLITN